MLCPECHRPTKIPERNVSNLPTNVCLQSLAEKHKRHTDKQQSTVAVPFCSEHDGEKLHFYCLTCQVTACQAFLVLNHERPKHTIKSVKDVHQEKMKIMEATVKRNEKLTADFRKSSQHVTDCEQNIHACIKRSEEDIDRAAAMAIRAVEKQAQELKQTLHYENSQMLEKCQKKKTDLNKKAHELQGIVDEARKVTKTRSSHEYLDHHTKITKQFIDLETKRKAEKLYDVYVTSFRFTEELLVNLGTAHTKRVRKIKLRQTYNFPDAITSIACGSGLLVVTVQNKETVQVYEQESDKLTKHKFNLAPTKKDWYPYGVAVTNAPNILVVGINYVEVYSISGTHERSIRTYQFEHYYGNNAVGVTTTTNGHILLGQLHSLSFAIDCYFPDGRQCTQMKGDIEFFLNPWKLAAIGNEYVAVSNLEDKVCVLSFKHGSTNLNLKTHIDIANPTAICYDKETNCLLIAHKDAEQDAEDGAVIEQYCWRNGAKIATLAQGLKDPQDMAFTDDGMLAVTDDKKIQFYKTTIETLDLMDK